MCTPPSRSAPRRGRILWRHILPNIMPPIIVLFTTRVGTVILAESSLSFLGLGVPPPTPTWGGMLSGSGRTFMFQGPWLALAPGLCLTVVVYATNVFGDALRDLLDPRMRGSQISAKNTHSGGKPCLVLACRIGASGRGASIAATLLVAGNPACGAIGAAAEARRHAGGRHRLRHAVGAVVRFRRLELEAQPRHRRGLRTAVRRRPLQVEDGSAASIRSMPTPGCRRTRSAANWPRAGNGSKIRCALEINLRKGVMFPEKPGVMAARELVADDVVFSLQPPRQEPEEDLRLFRSSRQGRGHRQAHRGVHLQELQRRMGLSLRLGLLLRHHAEGSRRRRRRQLEERQRHRPVHARPISCRAIPTPTSKNPNYWGNEKINGVEIQAAAARQGGLSHHQGRGDVPDRAAHRQARHSREHPLVGGRRTEKERAATAMVEMAQS